jgi:tRNA dimethylallyltransferase
VTGGRVLALTGPTTSGKTRLSIPLARRLDGEVISMDSRQVYRGMDVGTDKVREPERRLVPHHGLDLLDPDEAFSAGRWAREARRWIREIRERGRLPVLVGGTGFFLSALMQPVFREPPIEAERRRRLRGWLDGVPVSVLERWARALDPGRAEVAAAGGRQRLSRTLEVALLTGRPLSWWHAHAPPDADPVPVGIVLLTLPRERLYRQIDARADRMFREEGLLAEVRDLLEAGYSRRDPGMTGTGYREAAAVLRGEASLEEAIDEVQRVTRGYARRQLTWFRNQLPPPGPDLVQVDATLPGEDQVEAVLEWWRRTGGDSRG